MEEKKIIRGKIKELKKLLSAEGREAQSRCLCEQIRALPVYQRAKVVMMYYPLPDEVDVSPLLEDEKKFLLPVVVGSAGPVPLIPTILLREYRGTETLSSGSFSILEPSQEEEFTDYEQIDLVIVPGIAFTSEGYRLGRGKGYYDNFLSKVKRAYKLGVGYSFQLLDSLPVEPHDVKLDEILVSACDK